VGIAPVYLAVADVNGDGSADLICANVGNKTLTVLTNSLIPTLGLPALTIHSTNNNPLLLSWPAVATGFVLQQNPVLGTTNWVNVTNFINEVNWTNQMSVLPAGNNFYRLYRPDCFLR
jgi:hypothetical protein